MKKYYNKSKKKNSKAKNKKIAVFISVTVIISIIITTICLCNKTPEMPNTAYGYDISEHNSVIDCKSARKDGKSFVMIRLGYYNKLDKHFYENIKNAHKNKMPFGLYLYSYALNEDEAKTEAEFVIKTIKSMGKYKKYFTLPVAYDLENEKLIKYGRRQITEQMVTFCERIKKAGYSPMVYANTTWFENYIDSNVIKDKDYRVWYALWGRGKPKDNKPIRVGTTDLYADIWQYKEGNTMIGTLDENILYDSKKIIKD